MNKFKLRYIFTLSLIIILTISFVTIYFVRMSKYKLTLFSWADYYTASMLHHFETETDIKIREIVYPNLEAMTSKLYVSSYDIITTTDYKVNQLVSNDWIQPIDYTNTYFSPDLALPFDSEGDIDSQVDTMQEEGRFIDLWYNIATNYPIGESETLYDYMIPIVFGDYKIIYNVNSPIVQQMVIEEPELVGTYESLKWIGEHDGTVVANSYPTDVIGIGLKATGHSANDITEESLQDAEDFLIPTFQNGKFQGNELGDLITNYNSWDVAYCFSGDIMTGIIDNWIYLEYDNFGPNHSAGPDNKIDPWYDYFAFYTPMVVMEESDANYDSSSSVIGQKSEAPILWFDGIVISSNLTSEQKDYVYQFINFFTSVAISFGSWINESEINSISDEAFKAYYGGIIKYTYYLSPVETIYNSTTIPISDDAYGQDFEQLTNIYPDSGSSDLNTNYVFDDGYGTNSSEFFSNYYVSYFGSENATLHQSEYNMASSINDLDSSTNSNNRAANSNYYYDESIKEWGYFNGCGNETEVECAPHSNHYLYEQGLMLSQDTYEYFMDPTLTSEEMFNNPSGPEMLNYTSEEISMIVNVYNEILMSI